MNLSCPQLTISHVMLHFLKQILSTTEIYGVPAGARQTAEWSEPLLSPSFLSLGV